MSNLAHSNDETMDEIEATRLVSDDFPTALTIVKAISLAGQLKGGEYYMTRLQMIALCKAWLAKNGERIQERKLHPTIAAALAPFAPKLNPTAPTEGE